VRICKNTVELLVTSDPGASNQILPLRVIRPMKKILSIAAGSFAAGLVLITSVFAPRTSAGHGVGECSRIAGALNRSLKLPEVHERRPYDVLSYDLSLDWRRPMIDKKPVYSGVQEMRVRITAPTKAIEIDASALVLDSAWVDGQRFSIGASPEDDKFRFTFAEELAVGKELTVRMAFTRVSSANVGAYFAPKGFYIGPSEWGDSVIVEEDLIYTQSEPLDAQYWMPCMNLPYDKAESRIRIRVPAEFVGISNGILEATNSHTDGSRTFVWKSDKPIASYLMVANASKFVEWDEKYARPTNPADSVRAIFYAWLPDYLHTETDGSQYNARHAFRNTTKILHDFSLLFGEYPFEQYGQVPVQPYGFGGMEHQGMTTVNRRWLRGFDESGIAHELGHQWFGDKVTCETWDDLWLNEGFASYTEALWAEINGGEAAYLDVVRGYADWYFQRGLTSASIFGPPALQAFNQDYAPLVYGKASSVLHLLRRLVANDTLYFNAIRDYTNNFAYSHITTAKFEQYMSARLGIDLTQFFKQWIYGPSHPFYEVRWNQVGNSLTMKIEQQQEEDVFEAPLRFFVSNHDGSVDTFVVNNTERIQFANFATARDVDEVALDKDWSMLSMSDLFQDIKMGVDDQNAKQVAFSVHGSALHVASASAINGSLRITDVLGRTIYLAQATSEQVLAIDITPFPTGSYFVTLDSSGHRETYKFQR
jgi:aminopeptidase N